MDALVYFAISSLHEHLVSVVTLSTGFVSALYAVSAISNFYRDSMRSKINVK